MGVVWRGRDTLLGREVAVKLLGLGKPSREALCEGVRGIIDIEHPGLVRVYSAGQQEELVYVVMELIEGESLASVLQRVGKLDAPTAAKIMVQVCEAVGALHTRGVVHRDIKPGNIMLARDGRVLVTDFGLASERPYGTIGGDAAQSGFTAGTPAYMAPEMFDGIVTARTDVYALGVTLFELLTGRVPFEGPVSVLRDMHAARAVPLFEVRESLPAMAEIVERAMQKDPVFRYKSADRIGDAITREVVRSKSQSRFASPTTSDRSTPDHSSPRTGSHEAIVAQKRVRTKVEAPPPRVEDGHLQVTAVTLAETAETICAIELQIDCCPECGYELNGLSNSVRCPECGTPSMRRWVFNELDSVALDKLERLRRRWLVASTLMLSPPVVGFAALTALLEPDVGRVFSAHPSLHLLGAALVLCASVTALTVTVDRTYRLLLDRSRGSLRTTAWTLTALLTAQTIYKGVTGQHGESLVFQVIACVFAQVAIALTIDAASPLNRRETRDDLLRQLGYTVDRRVYLEVLAGLSATRAFFTKWRWATCLVAQQTATISIVLVLRFAADTSPFGHWMNGFLFIIWSAMSQQFARKASATADAIEMYRSKRRLGFPRTGVATRASNF